MIETAVLGTKHLLELLPTLGARRLLFTSSGAVYGPQPRGVPLVPEDHAGAPDPLDPASAYAHAKRLAEHMVCSRGGSEALEVVIARGFAFVGPRLPLDEHFAIGNFVRDGLEGRPIRVNGDGTAVRSYLYGSDLAAWLWTLLFAGTPSRAYNVGSEEAITIRALADVVGAHFGVGVDAPRSPASPEPGALYVPSTARARSELGLRQRVGLAEAIARTASHHTSEAPRDP
jgi:dTDP-glucose 4,6-dehydratase